MLNANCMHQEYKKISVWLDYDNPIKARSSGSRIIKNGQLFALAWLQDFKTSTSFNKTDISAIRQTTSNKKQQYRRDVFFNTLSEIY